MIQGHERKVNVTKFSDDNSILGMVTGGTGLVVLGLAAGASVLLGTIGSEIGGGLGGGFYDLITD